MGGKAESRIVNPNAQADAMSAAQALLQQRGEEESARTQLLAELVDAVEELTVTVRSCVDAFIDKKTSKQLSKAIERRMELRAELRGRDESEDGNGDSTDTGAVDEVGSKR